VLSSLPLVGGAFSTAANARTRTELVFLVTVNAEEPPALVPVEADAPSPRREPTAPPDPGPPGRRVERVGMTGDAT
jgi:Flp pilus assembly secretin CpaC